MSILTQVFQASNVADLVSAVNTALALLVGGSAATLLQVSVTQPQVQVRRKTKAAQLQASFTINTTPVGGQATPFVLNLVVAGDPATLATNINAVAATGGLNFVSGARLISQNIPREIPQLMAWILTSTDAGASANYTPK
jgi:hypothetical protein